MKRNSSGEQSKACLKRCYAALAVISCFLGCCNVYAATPATHTETRPQSVETIPTQSTFFSTAAEEAYPTYQLHGDGDLWPSCWAAGNHLYTANGDGAAFTGGTHRYDMAISVIKGMPPHLSGKTLAWNVGTNWSGPGYNRKPTGMLCIHGDIYLAFQNLNDKNFEDAPAASVAESADNGKTWKWNKQAPMFGTPKHPDSPSAYKFTTVFFLDFGKNSANAIDGYVYAYGLNYSWRNRTKLYLARVPDREVMQRSKWRFYTGMNGKSTPIWTSDITKMKPVLVDDEILDPAVLGRGCPAKEYVIGQGGVVYDAPIHRYIFASWACTAHVFFEAPEPWGPWAHFLTHTFGGRYMTHNHGMYGTSIPSKFISADGKTLYVQSNICCGGDSYTFSLRKLYLQTYKPTAPANGFSSVNLAAMPGTRAISNGTQFGLLCGRDCSDALVSGSPKRSENDDDGIVKTVDWWGYIWPRSYNMDHVIYETGDISPDGGWYTSNLHVQVRQNFRWVDVSDVRVSPTYPYNNTVRPHSAYTISFHATCGDGIRIIGVPGGSSHFTSITQLSIYFGGGNRTFVPSANCKIAMPTHIPIAATNPDHQ